MNNIKSTETFDSFFDNDVWDLTKLPLSDSRINKSNRFESINFLRIANTSNKTLLKKYTRYLFSNTRLSLSSIVARAYRLNIFLIFCGDINLQDLSRRDIEKYYELLSTRDINDKSYNEYVYSAYVFLEHCCIYGYILTNHTYFGDCRKIRYTQKMRCMDEDVIMQIFDILDKIPFKICCMFLLIYCTGMRSSEVCELKTDCLYKTKDGAFVRFYQTKMRKEVTNPIPEGLYKLLKKYRRQTYDNLNPHPYMFSTTEKVYQAASFRVAMQTVCEKYTIKTAEGKIYRFRGHDFRHVLATDMVRNDIPIQVVQKILHHTSPEMTLAYVEINDEHRLKKFTEFITTTGEVSLDISKAQWLRSNINAQMLPNGICTLPIAYKKCPHANCCLVCSNFFTSAEYIAIHKKQLANTISYLELAKANGFIRQVETNELIKANLEAIIQRIEGRHAGEDGKQCPKC